MKKNMFRRGLSLLCAVVLALTLAPAAGAAGLSFTDVRPGDWYYDTVMEMAERGMLSGLPDGSFRPAQLISRVELAAIALRVFPDAKVELDYDPELALKELQEENPGFWGNTVIRDAALRGIYIFGTSQEEWSKPATRAEVVGILVKFYDNSHEEPLEIMQEAALLIGDYETAVAGHDMEPMILWMYSNGILTGVNEQGDFNPEGQCTRAEACTMVSNLLHPENWIQYDWDQVVREHQNQESQTQTPAARADFTGQLRERYAEDVAYDYCRALEEEIGIQIFYLPEWTQKAAGLLSYDDVAWLHKDENYFRMVLEELKKMKAAYDLYPEGFLKEVVNGKNNRKTEIILCPYTFEGMTCYGVHVYDESGDAQKVDQIYYTGTGDSQYYSHEMGHMVMSSMAIRMGWNATCQAWEDCTGDVCDYVSGYAMMSRPEDWAETWAYLWHQTDTVGGMIRSGAQGLKAKVELLTRMMDQYDTVDTSRLPWYSLL